jgi:hypothetical protein
MMYTSLGMNGPTSSGFRYGSCCLAPEVLVVGVTSFREREGPKSLEWWWWFNFYYIVF